MSYIKKQELQSVIECVKKNEFEFYQYSYGAWAAGYITNFAVTIRNDEHIKKYGRAIYWVLFSARGYGKLSTYGSTYNGSWRDKYRQYEEKVYNIMNNAELLSRYLH